MTFTTGLSALPEVEPLDQSLRGELQHIIDTKTKPPGSLGQLETLARQMGLIQRSTRPAVERPVLIVFAGDHGIAAEGVSPYPQAVTAQMVANFLAGGAAVNAFSRVAGIELEVVNAGIATPLPRTDGLVDISVAAGTRNFAHEPAMTHDEALTAMQAGAARVRHHAALGSNVIGFGEMGIANTSAAACLMSRLCGVPIDECVGRGTGLDDAGLAKKRAVLAAALAHHDACHAAFDVLATFGGFEIAMMAGAYLAAAHARMTIVVDGFIASSALLVADAIAPHVREYCVFAHASDEAGHRRMLAHFGAKPLLSLDMRLGEGTGAALAVPLLRAACAFINEMASFESAGVANREA
ncbi:nicotinate-nucleotide--dimethylbenzimidazole phosphoribosyltransferase [Paraburkholderia phenoliruptrix]|uniref:Nicotinate-nucleotide--dimethylbenzimidazole phosphoribosyltransferase n=2 Tax=Paraburkholderia phenoliruptrix TaxID=252970 RepID=K0DJE9_9BURK|nr:nicotinate-nucleotide--dimethylbenzimidazole phosphoribosyltransferase [Paraburkholderia phenoliruptrix]AFT84920.1 nicotinate-nucleotide--dimethylbenzimidazole phosphoribosyltransferase [Paraburkholderia phenoliruptrix BR3459a]CAB4050358.1 Nicotinate-nucleotide--dimethylbenzimidazole phosphoribosyltransferase [Paraburkholderia phenoliruptrix]